MRSTLHKQPHAGACFAASQAPQFETSRPRTPFEDRFSRSDFRNQDFDLAASVRSQLDSSYEISEDLSRVCGGKCSFELHLDAIVLHGDVTDLVDLAAHRQV